MRWLKWIDDRLPVSEAWNRHLAQYPVPKNLNIWYVFGSLLLLVIVNQLLTGIWLAMYYEPTASGAFQSITYIMRDVNFGWLIRYLHSTGASALFILMYLHMFRGQLYGSYQRPRELLWLFGMLLMVVFMAEAFMGYLLPWGQMSYWGAQVITSLFGTVPFVGDSLVQWVRGDYAVSGVTLNRFFALHVIGLPLLLLVLVVLHVLALHHVGSNNPDGIEIKRPKGSVPEDQQSTARFTFHDAYRSQHDLVDAVPFHPYLTVKDLVGVGIFLMIFCYVVFFHPDGFGHFLEPDNSLPSDAMQTPPHIAPVWYFTPFYAMLRAIPDKMMGAVTMFSAIGILFFLPWLDRSTVRSVRYRSRWHRCNLALFAVSFIWLGVLGSQAVSPLNVWTARVMTVAYFLHFFLLWWYSRRERTRPLPERVSS